MGTTPQEQNLIKQCQAGNAKAQERLYTTMANKMFAVCLRYANSQQDAEDVLQEAFIKVFKNLSKFKFQGSFEGWVRRIMVNTSIEHHRKNAKWKFTEDVQEVSIQEGSIGVLEKLKADDLLTLVQSLPDGYRTVFNMYAIEGYNHQDIADILGVSVNTSKSQLFKARAALQQKLMELEKRERN